MIYKSITKLQILLYQRENIRNFTVDGKNRINIKAWIKVNILVFPIYFFVDFEGFIDCIELCFFRSFLQYKVTHQPL